MTFSKERFVIYRLFRLATSNLSLSRKVELVPWVCRASPKKNNQETKEEYYSRVRLVPDKICWADVYGLGVFMENANDISVELVHVYKDLLLIFRERRGRWTNNHLVMNNLILKSKGVRLSEIGIRHVIKDNKWLENSTHYLFVFALRCWRADYPLAYNNNSFTSFFNYSLKYYNELSWIGDICPDKLVLPIIDSPIKNELIKFENIIIYTCDKFMFKISLNNDNSRHGHVDGGSFTLHSPLINIVDRGIDDLGNSLLKKSDQHTFSTDNFDNINIEEGNIYIKNKFYSIRIDMLLNEWTIDVRDKTVFNIARELGSETYFTAYGLRRQFDPLIVRSLSLGETGLKVN